MMNCIFTVGGVDLDVDACLRACHFETYSIYRKGEVHGKKGRVQQHSGFGVTVSDADWDDLRGQIEDAIAFLKTNAHDLQKLVRFSGIGRSHTRFPDLEARLRRAFL